MSDVPTAREYGRLEREIAESKHAVRNLRMVAESSQERIRDLELQFARLQTRIFTALLVVVALAEVVVWFTR